MAFDLDAFVMKYKVHEETVSFLKMSLEEAAKPFYELSIEDARQANLQRAKKYAGSVDFEGITKDFTVPSYDNKDGIPITSYRAKTCNLTVAPPIMVYFHGGGNCMGSRQTYDTVCKVISRDAGCVVVSVEYRLAPEHKFPANHNDAKAAVRWTLMNKSLVGASNNSKVGVGGDSSGGRMAGIVCHEVPGLAFQVLVYPSVGFVERYKSHEEFEDGPILSKRTLDWCLDNYIDENDRSNPRGNLMLQKSYSNLPPALVIVAELDPLRDGCYAYHEKLKESGIKSQVLTINGAPHAFFHLPGHFKECCRRAYEKTAMFIKANS
ncbi:hypothetical protein CHS0354_014571 [Potamilus streckersoni]|uniref:Alpha/beta hydrolase fold-3 domain-containing protein n=1 Tax=Potamilus streckersoni TaxID=2493646 RepID=A0AAE0RNE7_9BIVA|nr:hypothetical protein CHS0354_014571 [Potamilus streckersoni]